jgi:hypothetical protein
MTMRRLTLPTALFATLLVTGCGPRTYYGPPPPPPPGYAVPPLIAQAERDGFRMGNEDGARDAYQGRGYHPRGDRNFKVTPGYDPAMGPYPPYRDRFRNSYLRGYDRGYYRR